MYGESMQALERDPLTSDGARHQPYLNRAESPASARAIDPRLLRAFVAVAREGHVSRAAEHLCLTQPAVSLQLKELARLTGLDLYSRTSHGVRLTHDGAALLPWAERALRGLDDLAHAAQRMKGSPRGTLRVGTILDPEFTRVGAFLHELVTLAPELQPELHHGISGTVLHQLMAGAIDVGYYLGDATADAARLALRHRSVPALHRMSLTRFTYRVVAPPGWGPRVCGKDWPALVRLPWILTPPASVHARLLADVLEPKGLQQNRAAVVDQEASMLALVRAGMGLSLARDAVALHESRSAGLVVADRVGIDATLSFVCQASQLRAPPISVALEALRKVWRQGQASSAEATAGTS
jgi:DNA-binding transcriptional LysR family regulator